MTNRHGLMAVVAVGAALACWPAVAAAQPFRGGLPQCVATLATVSSDHARCTADLDTCSVDHAICTSELATRTVEHAVCTTALATCNSQVAAAGPTCGHGTNHMLGHCRPRCRPLAAYPLREHGSGRGCPGGWSTELHGQRGRHDHRQRHETDVGEEERDAGVHDMGNLYTWDEALTIHVAGLNSHQFAGYTDWRMPNVEEFQTIVNYGTPTAPQSVTSLPQRVCALALMHGAELQLHWGRVVLDVHEPRLVCPGGQRIRSWFSCRPRLRDLQGRAQRGARGAGRRVIE